MNKASFFAYIIPRISNYVERLGFKYKKSKDGFLKDIEDGTIGVTFYFYQFAGTDNFNLTFQVRKKTVQQLHFKYNDINLKELKDSITFGINLTSLTRERENSYSFVGEKELDMLIDQKIIPFLTESLPVFQERYAKLGNIYKLYSDITEPNNKFIPTTYHSYITGLIVGWLHDLNNIDKVVAYFRHRFELLKEKWPEQYDVELYEANFDNIVEDLKRANGNIKLIGEYWSGNKC